MSGFGAPEPRLCLALRLLVEARHRGREHGATWEQLRAELAAEGLEVGNVRRLQEAAAYLRRAEKVAIVGDSVSGVYLVADEFDRRVACAERVKRIRALAKDLEALDRALYERIAGVLPLEDRAA